MARSCLRSIIDGRAFTRKISHPSITAVREYRYNKKGGMKPHRRISPHWREVDHNPADIPKSWVPDSWKKESVIDYEWEKEVANYIPGYKPKLRDEVHPNYHNEPVYQFSPETKLIDGLKHSLCLTKCVLFQELPQHIKDLSDIVSISKQDDRVIQIFRKALLFDLDPKAVKRKPFKEYFVKDLYVGSSIERYCPEIIENLIRLCQSQSQSFPDLRKRIQVRDITTSVYFRRICDLSLESASDLERNWLVSILSSGGLQVLTQDKLRPFANEEKVKETESMEMPDIFPVFPIVDLKKTHVYENINSTGLLPGITNSNLHTLVLNNTTGLTPGEMYGQMATQLFACLYSRAIAEFGEIPMDLPRPLAGQCIASDGQNYQFLCMQLNTTKLDCDNGIKNMAWIENRISEVEHDFDYEPDSNFSAIPMYKECGHRVWRSPGYYADYDPKVFQTFLAMWLNGVV